MGNCLKGAIQGQQDATNLINSGDPAMMIGASQDTLEPSMPYNVLPGNYYPPVSTTERSMQPVEMENAHHGMHVGLSLGIGSAARGRAATDEEHRVRIAKRIGLIQHLPTRKFDGSKKGECVICMMELVEGEEVRYLPCMHTYHAVCIDDWLLRSLTCPSCMEPVDAALINSYHPTT